MFKSPHSTLPVFSIILFVALIYFDADSIAVKVDTTSIILLLATGWFFGWLTSVVIQQLNQLSEFAALKKVDELRFKAILDGLNFLKFNRRADSLVFFDFHELRLVYDIRKEKLYIFKDEDCISTSDRITDTQVLKDLIESINTRYKKQMNDCINVNGVLYSRHLFPAEQHQIIENFFSKEEVKVEKRTVKEYNIDDILDKISLNGMKSLSSEELEFLKKQKG
jgi:hypothetical protein